MRNKAKFTFLTLALTAGLILGACNSKPTPSSSSQEQSQSSSIPSSDSSQATSSSSLSTSSSSQAAATKFTVTFVVDGSTVQTSQVEEGEVAVYRGETPTKAQSGSSVYRFKGWDKDLSQPITADTTFNAVFEETQYASEIVVDDFESYRNSGRMKEDGGWKALTYTNANGWTTETNADVVLSTNAAEGQKALRFNAWENDGDYKFAKDFADGSITKSANAIKFNLMVPSMNLVKILVYAKATILGQERVADFKYTLGVTSNEYVEYIIPIADEGWGMYGEEGKTFPVVADYIGIHQDDVVKHITKIEFYIKGNDGIGGQPYAAFFDSFKFITLDNPQREYKQNITLRDRYTGLSASGNTVRLDVGANGAATATVLDLEIPMQIPGTYTRDGETLTFRSADNGASLVYTGKIVDNGKIINFVSASGALENEVTNMRLDAVQVVDDFEQYTESGVAYSQKNNDATQISGARGAFYAEHYTNNGSSDWGKSGWQLLPEGDEINLIEDEVGAHSGKNYLSLKHFSGNAVRYMPWGLANGLGEKNCFRGSKFSFWAKGFVNQLTVTAVSHSDPTPSSVSGNSGYFKKQVFNIGNNVSEWTHIEVDVNPKLVYYGFIIMIEKDYVSDSQLYIDDIEFYNADPYATYVPPEVKTMPVTMSYNAIVKDYFTAQLFIRSETQVYLMIPGLLSTSLKGTYTFDEVQIVITFENNGGVYTADVSEDLRTISFKSVSGSGQAAQFLNGISFKMFDYADNAEMYADDGAMYYQGNTNASNRSGARGAYYCEYKSGYGSSSVGGKDWTLMGGAGDQLMLGTSEGQQDPALRAYEGQKYLRMKKSTAGDMRYMEWGLFDGTAEAHKGVSKFSIALNNPLSTSTNVIVSVYKARKITTDNLDTAKVDMEITLTANQEWKVYTINLDPSETYYGYAVLAPKASATGYFGVDLAYYYNVDNDPDLFYHAKKDLVLNGTIVAGAASIKFDEGGKFYFTCATLGANNAEGSYDMDLVDYSTQYMTLSIQGTTVRGIYAVTEAGVVTFTVTEVSGTMATYIAAGTVFSNQ